MRTASTLSPTRWCHRSSSTVRSLEEVGDEAAVSSTCSKLCFSLKQVAIALQLSHHRVDKLADEITCCGSRRTTFKSTSARQGTALLAQASRAAVWTAVGSNYRDGPSALVKLFCSLWIFVSTFVLSSQTADRSCYQLGQNWKSRFSLSGGVYLLSALWMSPASLP